MHLKSQKNMNASRSKVSSRRILVWNNIMRVVRCSNQILKIDRECDRWVLKRPEYFLSTLLMSTFIRAATIPYVSNLKLEFDFQFSTFNFQRALGWVRMPWGRWAERECLDGVGLSEGAKEGSHHWATTRVRVRAKRSEFNFEIWELKVESWIQLSSWTLVMPLYRYPIPPHSKKIGVSLNPPKMFSEMHRIQKTSFHIYETFKGSSRVSRGGTFTYETFFNPLPPPEVTGVTIYRSIAKN
jgi:hypothetical protein